MEQLKEYSMLQKLLKKEHSEGNKVIVVVSAMAGKTNELLNLANEISEEFNRELDVLLSSGEQATAHFYLQR